jgi:hypothetical protein
MDREMAFIVPLSWQRFDVRVGLGRPVSSGSSLAGAGSYRRLVARRATREPLAAGPPAAGGGERVDGGDRGHGVSTGSRPRASPPLPSGIEVADEALLPPLLERLVGEDVVLEPADAELGCGKLLERAMGEPLRAREERVELGRAPVAVTDRHFLLWPG